MKKYNRLLSLSLLGISPFLFQGTALAEITTLNPELPTIGQYSKSPSYITSGAKPLVMFLLDTSGSMAFDAYTDDCNSSDTGGYGYFDPDLNYENTGTTNNKLFKSVDSGGTSGRYLNCKYMRRIDIARKVLTGGNVPSGGTTMDSAKNILTTTLQTTHDTGTGTWSLSWSSGWTWNPVLYDIRVVVPGEVSGALQSSANDVRFGLTTFDTSGENKGGKVFQPIGGSVDEMITTINNVIPKGGTPLAESLWTIIGYFQQSYKEHYESGSWYQQDKAYEINTTYPVPTNKSVWDPFYNTDEKIKLDCAPAYVITITDGLPSADFDIPSGLKNSGGGEQITTMQDDNYNWISIYYDDVSWYAQNNDLRSDIAGTQKLGIYNIFTFGTDRGLTLMETSSRNGGTKKAYQANSGEAIATALGDILGDITANATTASSISVVQGSRDGFGATYQASYFPEKESADGKTTVTWVGDVQALFIDSAGNLRENTKDNPLYPNQLDPTKDRIYTTESTIDGVVAKLYNDYNGDGVLDKELLSEPDEGKDLNGDGDKLDILDENAATQVPIEDVEYLWSASDWLNSDNLKFNQRNYTGSGHRRFITTWIDTDNNGQIDAGERYDFTASVLGKKAFLGYFLGTNTGENSDFNGDGNVDSTDLDNLINYIRGQEITGMRSRTLDGITYRLGDIIDSTPTSVQTPKDNFDTRFNSTTYREFKQAYADRRTMVYAGGNDGLFHAFNGGFFQASYSPGETTTPITNKFWLHRDTSGEEVTYDDDAGLPLGAEMWAYAPYNLLPHLQWLAREDYQHVYYNDLKPKVFAARLWKDGTDADDIHVGGWGTLLIGGMQWGGGPITTNVNAGNSGAAADNRTMRSAYFVFDITDPELKPVLLSEFTLDDDDRFSFANVYPSVIPVKKDTSKTDPDSWFLAMGNGPTNLKAESNQVGRLIVRQFKTNLNIGQGFINTTGDLWEKIGATTTTTTTAGDVETQSPEVFFPATGEDNSFISNPYTPDLQQGTAAGAFTADVTYFGTVSGFFPEDENYPGTWSGKMHRVVIQEATTPSDPNTWKESVFYNANAPITTTPVMGQDDKGRYWLFFGTGRFYDKQDKKNLQAQSFYGLKEPSTDTSNPYYSGTVGANILNVTGAKVYVGDSASDSPVTGLESTLGSISFANLENFMDSTYDGWRVDFDAASGERNLTDSLLVSGYIIFNTYSPDYGLCDTGGTSNVYARYYKTGTAYWEGSVGVDEEDTYGETKFKRALDTFKVSGFLPKLTYIAGDASQSGNDGSTTGALIGISSTSELMNIELTPPLKSASGKISWEQENAE